MEIVRRAYEALNRALRSGGAPRDVDAWLDAFHPDVEVFDIPTFPDAQVRRGHDDMRKWIEMMVDVFSRGGRWEPEQVTAAGGDFVLVSVPVATVRGEKAGLLSRPGSSRSSRCGIGRFIKSGPD